MRKLSVFFLLVAALAVPARAQTSFDTSQTGQTGEKVLGSYFSTDIDTVSMTNGNLHLSIPLFNLPGRELPVHLAMNYDSLFTEKRTSLTGYPSYQSYQWRKDTGFGGSLTGLVSTVGHDSNNYPIYQSDFYWVETNGAKHHFQSGQSTNYYAVYYGYYLASTDSEFLQFYNGSGGGGLFGEIWQKNGTVSLWGTDGGNYSIPVTMTTPNGNQLTASDTSTGTTLPSGESLYDLLPLSDTVGRTISYSDNGTTVTITLKDANNANQVYSYQWTTLTGVQVPDRSWSTDTWNMKVLSSITLPNGKSYSFTYDSTSGALTKVTLPSGAYIRYTYARFYPYTAYTGSTDGPLLVASRNVSEDGTTEQTWTYSYAFAVNASPGYWFDTSTYTWNAHITSTTVTDPTGANVVHTFDANGLETQTTYQDSTGSPVRTDVRTWSAGSNPSVQTVQTATDAQTKWEKTVLGYDSYNNPTTETWYDYDESEIGYKQTTYVGSACTNNHILDRIASETLYKPDNSVTASTTYAYDEYSLTARSSVPGHNGNTSETGRCDLTTVQRYKDATNYTTEHLKYDNVGNVVEKDDALGHATLIDFSDNFSDASKNGNTYAYPKKVTNPLSQYTQTKYDFNTGLPMVTTDLRGDNTTNTYDIMNRLTSVTEPNGKETTYTYDDTNRKTTKEVTVDSSGNKGHVETYFDHLYRVIQTKTNDPQGQFAVDTVYDALNRKVQVSNPYRTSGAASAWTYSAYDPIGRVACTSISTYTTSPCASGGPTDAKVQYVYGGNTTTTINEAGNQRRYTYNGLGKMVKVEEPNPDLTTPLVTTYTYELTGPIKTTSQSGQTRTLTHDFLGRETQEVLPESGTTNYTYDDAGHMLTATDARSVVTTYTYDYLGRATQRSYSDSTPTVSFGYDASGYTGLRTSMTDAVGSVGYTYDTMNRLTQESRSLTGVTGTFSTSYAYNIKGDLTQMTYPSGRVVNFNYAAGGGCCNSRLSSVADATTSLTIANGMTYEPSGAINARTLNPNGSIPVAQTFAYNSRLQQTQVRAEEGSTYVQDFSYGYGTTADTGELLSRTDAIQPEHSVNYTYDSIYRLSQVTSADASWGIAWTFDAWGNRLTQTPAGYVYSASIVGTQSLGYTNNRISSISGYTYDSAGNVTNEGSGGHAYAYNGKNQITRIDGSSTDNYLYDGEGRRAEKIISGVSTFYFYGPGNAIISEFTTTTGATAASSSDKTAYQTSDSQGTAVLLIASSGLVLENNRTLPYGELWCAPVASANTTKFTTYERDQESNLDYAMNRYLANNYGRFMSSDKGPVTLSIPATLNRYNYVIANPVNLTDPEGNACGDPGVVCFAFAPPPPPPPTGSAGGDPNNPCIEFGGVGSGNWQQALSPCEGLEPGGGPPEPPPPQCDRSDPTNAKVLNFIDAHQGDAQTIANQLKVSVSDVLGIAGEESGWGLDYKVPLTNNYFGLHSGADPRRWANGQVGTFQTSKDGLLAVFQSSNGFLMSGLDFAKRESAFVTGKSDPGQFAAILHDHGYGVGNSNFLSLAVGAINSVSSRINCPK